MKLITWNVNSIRTRLPRALALLERHAPDVLCLQETKVTDDAFPTAAFEDAGYHVAHWGQQGYNGVALISQKPADAIERSFDGNPSPDEARAIVGQFGNVKVVNLYVINGKSVDDPRYQDKLDWLDVFGRWLGKFNDPNQQIAVVGDFNIAPDERDVWDVGRTRDSLLCTDAERERLQKLLSWGLIDLQRQRTEEAGIFSWWDYRYGAFHRNWGLRIDLILATRDLAARCADVRVDREERKPKSGPGKPSDHAPVVATFED